MITTRDLTKRYGRLAAVDGVGLEVREGDRYGLLGPNGSGKTTLVRMLLGLVFATRGEIEVLGRPVPRRVKEVLPEIGALVEGPGAYPHLSGRTNLRLFDAAGPGGARRDRDRRIGEALERVGLAGIDRRPVRAYSLGMRQRLGLASALLGDPEYLVLDEPANGLDPAGMAWLRTLLRRLAADGRTVLVSSHVLSEVAQTAASVVIVNHGRLRYAGPLADLGAGGGSLEDAFLRLTAPVS
jgi:ABC-type multidrug transport system ATPase subunit